MLNIRKKAHYLIEKSSEYQVAFYKIVIIIITIGIEEKYISTYNHR